MTMSPAVFLFMTCLMIFVWEMGKLFYRLLSIKPPPPIKAKPVSGETYEDEMNHYYDILDVNTLDDTFVYRARYATDIKRTKSLAMFYKNNWTKVC